MTTRTITVSTQAELSNALATCTGGETILLKEGNYGSLNLGSKTSFDFEWPSEVTIASADPENPATFSSLNIRGASNLTFDGITFDYTYNSTDTDSDIRPFVVEKCQDISIRNCTFDGDIASGTGGTADGYGWSVGLAVRDSTGVVVESSEFYDLKRGLTVSNCADIEVVGNDMHDIRSDGMNFVDVQGVVIEDNWIHDFQSTTASADHRDMIQFWTTGTTQPSTDIIIRGNLLDIGDGLGTQSIFMRNEMVDTGQASFAAMAYQNVLIEDNVIVNAHLHGITVGETNGLVIKNNSVLHADGEASDGTDGGVEIPTIRVSGKSVGVVIQNNMAADIVGYSGQPSWKVLGNVLVQDQDPSKAGWYGDIFIGSTLAEDGVHDFLALPGGPIALVGASGTRPLPNGELQPLFHITQDPDDSATRTFDARYSMGPDGKFPAGSTCVWQFSDGTSAKGEAVSHTFTDGGGYGVRLTVILPDGTRAMTKTIVDVQDPQLLSYEAGSAFLTYDSGRVSPLTCGALTDAGLKLGASGTALKVSMGQVAEIEGADEFQISLSLKASSSTGSGEVFRMHGGMYFTVNSKGEAYLKVSHADGSTTKLTVTGVNLLDGREHDVLIDYDDGILSLSVDGKGTVKAPSAPDLNLADRGLEFGSPFGDTNFKGLLTSFELTVDASDYPPEPQTTILKDSSPIEVIDLPQLEGDGVTTSEPNPEPGPQPQPEPEGSADPDPDHDLEILSYEAGGAGFMADTTSGLVKVASVAGPAGLTLGASGTTLSVSKSHLSELVGSNAFDIDVGFEATEGGKTGELFRMHGSFIAWVTSTGELKFQAFHADGRSTTVTTTGADLTDGGAHALSISYDDDTLSLIVDGAVLGQAAMVAPLTSYDGHGLTFGNPWGKQNAQGLLTEFEVSVDDPELAFARTAMEAEVQQTFTPTLDWTTEGTHLVPLT